jgi:hypothetical protein
MSTPTGESNEMDAPQAPAPADEAAAASAAADGAAAASAAQRAEADQRAAYEAELNRISSSDMVLQAAASLLNIGAHRLGLTGPAAGDLGAGAGAPARDLDQVRDAIDAVRGLLPVIERARPQELRPLRDALSQLQMAYARETRSAGPAPGASAVPPSGRPPAPAGAGSGQPGAPGAEPGRTGSAPSGEPSTEPGPGPAESSGRLWVPGR